MVKIIIDMPEGVSKKVELYKINNNLKTKADAVVAILRGVFLED